MTQCDRAYPTQQELIDDQLIAIRHRIRACVQRIDAWLQAEQPWTGWPTEVLELEQRIAHRQHASSPDLPLTQLCARFELTASEQRIVWVLLAHELCPIARDLLRSLSTEDAPDVTKDVLRRVVYGMAFSARAWRELDDDATLIRFGLVERSDRGDDAPEHRQTWKLARRVLALAYGELQLDRALSPYASREPEVRGLDQLVLPRGVAEQIAAGFERDLVIVHGRSGTGRRSALLAVARARGRDVLIVDGRQLATDREEGPFRTGVAEMTDADAKQLRAFWESLSRATRDAITNNELPGGEKIVIRGYASARGGDNGNDELALERAQQVMQRLMGISGNQDSMKIFRPTTEGESESPQPADRRPARDDPADRKVVITLKDVHVHGGKAP